MYIDKLNDIVNKHNHTYHNTIKMKPVDVNPSTYIDSTKEVNDKDSKFIVGNIVRISKYKNIFAKGYVTNTAPWTYVISDLKHEESIGRFYEKELQKTNQKYFFKLKK